MNQSSLPLKRKKDKTHIAVQATAQPQVAALNNQGTLANSPEKSPSQRHLNLQQYSPKIFTEEKEGESERSQVEDGIVALNAINEVQSRQSQMAQIKSLTKTKELREIEHRRKSSADRVQTTIGGYRRSIVIKKGSNSTTIDIFSHDGKHEIHQSFAEKSSEGGARNRLNSLKSNNQDMNVLVSSRPRSNNQRSKRFSTEMSVQNASEDTNQPLRRPVRVYKGGSQGSQLRRTQRYSLPPGEKGLLEMVRMNNAKLNEDEQNNYLQQSSNPLLRQLMSRGSFPQSVPQTSLGIKQLPQTQISFGEVSGDNLSKYHTQMNSTTETEFTKGTSAKSRFHETAQRKYRLNTQASMTKPHSLMSYPQSVCSQSKAGSSQVTRRSISQMQKQANHLRGAIQTSAAAQRLSQQNISGVAVFRRPGTNMSGDLRNLSGSSMIQTQNFGSQLIQANDSSSRLKTAAQVSQHRDHKKNPFWNQSREHRRSCEFSDGLDQARLIRKEVTIDSQEWGIKSTRQASEQDQLLASVHSYLPTQAQASTLPPTTREKLDLGLQKQPGQDLKATRRSKKQPKEMKEGRKAQSVSFIARESKFFGNQQKQRNKTDHLQAAFGGSEQTIVVLKDSVDAFQTQIKTLEDQPEGQDPSDRVTCNFNSFKNTQVVQSLLGASKNPAETDFKKEHTDSIRAKMNLLGSLRVNYNREGRAKSVDLDLMPKVSTNILQFQSAIPTALKPAQIPVLPQTQTGKKKKGQIGSKKKTRDPEDSMEEETLSQDQLMTMQPIRPSVLPSKTYSVRDLEETSMNAADQKIINISAKQATLTMTNLNQDQSHLTTLDQRSKQDVSFKGSQQESGTLLDVQPEQAKAKGMQVPEELVALQRERLESEKIAQGFAQLQQLDKSKRYKANAMVIKKLDPSRRVRMDDQWDVRRDKSASTNTIFVNPTIAVTNKMADLQKLKKAEDLSETYMAKKQKAFTQEQEERIHRHVEERMNRPETKMEEEELLRGLENQMIKYQEQVMRRQHKNNDMQKLLHQINTAVRQDAAETVAKAMKDTMKSQVMQWITAKSEVIKEAEEQKRREESEAEDANNDDFKSEQISDTDEEPADLNTAEHLAKLDAELEAKILKQMNAAVDSEDLDSVDNFNSTGQAQSALTSKVRKAKRKLSKYELSTPQLRQKRFTQELFGSEDLELDSRDSGYEESESLKILKSPDYSLRSITSGASSVDSSEYEKQTKQSRKLKHESQLSLPGRNKADKNLSSKDAQSPAPAEPFSALMRTKRPRAESNVVGLQRLLSSDQNMVTAYEKHEFNRKKTDVKAEKQGGVQRDQVAQLFKDYLTTEQIQRMESKVFKPVAAGDGSSQKVTDLIMKKATLSQTSMPEGQQAQPQRGTQFLDKVMADNAMQVMQNLKFQEVFKNQFDSAGYEEVFKEDPTFLYQKIVQQEKDVLLPLINKIKNRTLVLKDYTLNGGHCVALAEVWNQLGKPAVDVVYLDNCGVDDEEFSSLLKGFCALEQLQLLYYKENIFGPQALEAIQPLLMKRYPHNLRKLKLVKLNTSAIFVNELLEVLIQNPSNLLSLSLVQMAIPSATMPHIIEYLENAGVLEELDLSWNNFRPPDFLLLANFLQTNGILRILNLSWNLMIGSTDQKEKCLFQYPKDMQKFWGREDWEMSPSEILAARFSQMIRYNTQIQHIDLCNTGLSEQFLFSVVPALRRAKSLVSFHVGANPGINKKIQQFWQEKLRCGPKINPISIQVQKIVNNYKKMLADPDVESKIPSKHMTRLKFQSKQVESALMQETFALNAVQHKAIYSTMSEITVKANANDMSISRKLGHKIDIPGSGQWRMQLSSDEQHCWCCNNSTYSLVFWSKDIGSYHATSSLQIELKEKKRVIELIEKYNSDSEGREESKNIATNVPVLYSNVTNWAPRPFMKVIDLLEQLQGEQPNFDEQVNQALAKEKKFMYQDTEEVTEERKQQMVSWCKVKKRTLILEYRKNLFTNHKQILRSKLPFKKPQLINYELIADPENTWVLPIFLRPGRAHMFVKDAQKNQLLSMGSLRKRRPDFSIQDLTLDYYYSRHIIEIREEPIPKIAKQLAKQFRNLKFEKEFSVFKDWQEDTEKTYDRCLKHDKQYWKCGKFIKDKADLSNCLQIIRQHFADLKEVFLQVVAAGGDPPDIKQLDFLEYCQKAEIFDKAVTPSILDIYFAATNFEETEQDGNDDRALIRFEFLEILIRIVRGKYIETKKETTIADGLERLITEHILPTKDIFFTWQNFRTEHLWEYHVNELFETNLHLIEALYQQLKKLKTTSRAKGPAQGVRSKFLSHHNLVENISSYAVNLGVPARGLHAAFILSKMTVELENEDGPKHYAQIQFVEFIEFIGRVAYIKFQGTPYHEERSMAWKILETLKCLFPIIKEQPIDPDDQNVLQSDSDDDY